VKSYYQIAAMVCASEAGDTLLYSTTVSPITSDWFFFHIICIIVPRILEPSFCLIELSVECGLWPRKLMMMMSKTSTAQKMHIQNNNKRSGRRQK